ncbi:ArsR family transcriptional regulator, partial [Candidatus Kaiserbacteria bacterium]|nr:ArsR family transcriptional regulator [Candidatus Kaiserbacteria bacterium]
MKILEETLSDLGLIQTARVVLISLLTDGEATARVLSKRTGVTRPSVYDQLRDLRNRGLVVERDIRGKTFFAATDVSYLDSFVRDKIEALEARREALLEDLPSLLAQAQSVQPKIQFFEG